jgi:hypothetical protein
MVAPKSGDLYLFAARVVDKDDAEMRADALGARELV